LSATGRGWVLGSTIILDQKGPDVCQQEGKGPQKRRRVKYRRMPEKNRKWRKQEKKKKARLE